MTRKHFEAIAAALRSSRPADKNPDRGLRNRRLATDGDEVYDQWQEDVSRVADVLAASNPLFDRTRFWEACHR